MSDFTEPLGTRRAHRAGNLKSIGRGVATLRTEQCRNSLDETVQVGRAFEDSRRFFIRARKSHVADPARIRGTGQQIVVTSRLETELTVRSAADDIRVLIVLPVVFPPAHGTDLVGAALVQRSAATAGAAFSRQAVQWTCLSLRVPFQVPLETSLPLALSRSDHVPVAELPSNVPVRTTSEDGSGV